MTIGDPEEERRQLLVRVLALPAGRAARWGVRSQQHARAGCRVRGTRKWIGSSDAAALLRSQRVRCRLVDFKARDASAGQTLPPKPCARARERFSKVRTALLAAARRQLQLPRALAGGRWLCVSPPPPPGAALPRDVSS